jgi:CubicO group peptidase (beta-lactamase class C family)
MHFKRFLTLILLPGVIFSQKIDDNALKSLIAKTKETHSSALTIYFDDKLIFNECFDSLYSPIDAMSCTKSFVNLGIGLLISKGKIQSIDDPVYKYYPEWNQGLKKKITIRNLLNHTSGIQSLPNTSEIYRSPDYVQFALTADIVDTPGTKFFYNNNAVNILAGIIEKASGERMDKYIRDNIFKPLNIHDFYWQTDAYRYNGMKDTAYLSRGNPIAMAELMIKAEDMAKVGLLVLHNGNLNGAQIIQEKWIEESMKPGQVYNLTSGLLWWLIYDPAAIPV